MYLRFPALETFWLCLLQLKVNSWPTTLHRPPPQLCHFLGCGETTGEGVQDRGKGVAVFV